MIVAYTYLSIQGYTVTTMKHGEAFGALDARVDVAGVVCDGTQTPRGRHASADRRCYRCVTVRVAGVAPTPANHNVSGKCPLFEGHHEEYSSWCGIFTHPMSDYSDARILLVQSPGDDGLDMYAEFLHYHGFVPMPVTNAHDALNVAPAAAVIVTGILLHDSMDGIQLIDRLRGDDRTKNTPIIVLTACVWPSDRVHATDAGCDVFLPKPCLPDELLREVRRLLASSCGTPVSPPAHRKSISDVRDGERTCYG